MGPRQSSSLKSTGRDQPEKRRDHGGAAERGCRVSGVPDLSRAPVVSARAGLHPLLLAPAEVVVELAGALVEVVDEVAGGGGGVAGGRRQEQHGQEQGQAVQQEGGQHG